MTRREAWHYGLGLIACLLLWAIGRDALDVGAVLAIALIGTPHGAADSLRLRALTAAADGGLRRSRLLLCNAVYLAIAAAVWWLFLRWPAPALLGFVLISLLHFGATDAVAEWRALASNAAVSRHRVSAQSAVLLTASMSAVVAIAAPFVCWQTDVQAYLRWLGLTIEQAARFPTSAAAPALALALLLALLGSSRRFTQGWRLPTALWIAGPSLLLPPAAGFALYFCAVHAPRHWAHLRAEQTGLPLRPIVMTMLATAAIAAALLWRHDGAAFAPRLAQVVIVGLAALTVPHMLLDAVMRYRRATKEI
jgi:Brp/Blh family beta-carotene 15,15'-monooxygenase